METIVIGHRNPDMDSICSAIAYARLKQSLGESNVRSARCGSLNERILFVLEKFGVEQPDFLPDVTPRVSDVMVRDFVYIRPESSVGEALELMQQHRLRALPVVDEEGHFHGVLSENKLLGIFLPTRHSAERARYVRASVMNIARTFGGEFLSEELSSEEEEYALVVAAMDAETFSDRTVGMDPRRTVLFVGDREDVQISAIQAGLRAMVVTGGTEVSPRVVAAAREAGTGLVRSTRDTATSVFFARGAVEVRHVLEPCKLTFDQDRTLEHAKRKAVLSNQFIFPVLDGKGRLEGVLSKSDFLRPPARQLVLVDHNELSQAVAGATEIPIVEILDHHRLGNMPTETPITFINRPVGSTCTLVADLYERHGFCPDPGVAGLLMAGIISDTLNGTSPTATDLDRRILQSLATLAAISADDLSAQIFAVGSPLRSLAPRAIISADSKIYEERGVKFSVSQIEELTFSGFDERQADLLAALRGKVDKEGLFFAALLITDIKTQNSYFLVEGDPEFLRGISYPEYADNVWVLQGVVSRKKQLLPYLAELLAAVR
jgi:manganese-dependent inorganic pyrophosphatase